VPIENLNDLLDLYKRKFNASAAEGIDAVVQLNISGEGGGQHYMTIKDQTLAIEEGTAEDPTLTVTSTIENWLKMNLGQANPMTLIMTGKIKLSGSVPLAMKFQSLFFGS
jgi:putative sterol carrier protein